MRCRSAVAISSGRVAGASLVETLVALVVAAILLTSAWAWLWSVVGASHRYESRAAASADLAYAERLMTRELRAAVSLAPASAEGCSTSALSLTLRTPGASAEDTVSYVWDQRRAVVWRKTPSTYVVEHVSLFRITYFDYSGTAIVPVDGGRLSDSQAATVARMLFELCLTQGSTNVRTSWQVALEADI